MKYDTETYLKERFVIVCILNIAALAVCKVSGWNGDVQFYLSCLIITYYGFMNLSILLFNFNDKKYERYQSLQRAMKNTKKEIWCFRFVVVRLIVVYYSFNLTGNAIWLANAVIFFKLPLALSLKESFDNRKGA